MRRPALLLAALLLTSACTGGSSSDEPELPRAESFAEGTCRTVAEDVISIGRLLREVGDGPEVDQEVLDALRINQDALRAVAEGAEPEVKPELEKLALSVGFIRIRGVGKNYEPFIGEDAQQAYDDVLDACTEN